LAPRKISAFAFWGGVEIDLSQALINTPEIDICASAWMGGVTIKIPEGIPVDVHGFVLMGGTANQLKNTEVIPGAPLVRIRVRGMWGGVNIRHPRKRRRSSRHEVHELVRETIGRSMSVAQASIDHALGSGSLSDMIPPMPRDRRGRERARHRPDRGRGRDRDRYGRDRDERRGDRFDRDDDQRDHDDRHDDRTGSDDRAGSTTAPTSASAPSPSPASRNGSTPPATKIPSGTLTILVSDICGSTQLSQDLGDQAWLEVLQAHNEIVRRHVAEHRGTEVKAQGDGFLVVFPSARDAVLAAIAIQRGMSTYRDQHPEVPVTVRLGLHTGEVVATEDDVFGQNVVVASRIADAAGPSEVLVSGLTRDLTASASDLGFEAGTDVELKGLSQPTRVHKVLL
jgi:class 3 adenylate cyclase